jgi:NADH-quinone oxidoreductase subunit N
MTMTDIWIAVPLLILAGSSILVLILGAVSPAMNGLTVGVIACLASALWAVQIPPALSAPFLGIAATPLARLFIILFTLSSAAALLLSSNYNEQRGIAGEEYPATILFTTFGMVALASATNLLTLFLGLEAMTFGFYILVAIDLNCTVSSEAGLKYLLMGAIAAAFLAFGIALHYAGTGSLSITGMIGLSSGNPIAMAGWGFILVGIAFKLSLVPAHLWTPDVYQGAPPPVTALLSAASKGAGVLVLLQMLQGGNAAYLKTPLWWLALLSMIVGNLAALLQARIKRMLAYSSIAQMGYIAVALASGASGGYRAAACYAIAYAAMSLAAFGAITVLERETPLETIADYDGLGSSRPFAAGVLALALFSLAGIPPTAGFTGKFLIFAAAIKGGEISLAVIGILTSAVSAYYYLQVVAHLYMNRTTAACSPSLSTGETVVLGTVSAAIVFLGVWPSPLLKLLAQVMQ